MSKPRFSTRLTRLASVSLLAAVAAGSVACGVDEENQAPSDLAVDCAADDCNDETGFVPGDDEPAGGVCATVKAQLEPVVPSVVLLIDQSGSMNDAYESESRWSALYDALMNPSGGVVKSLESEVSFGLSLYTSYDGFNGGACPSLTDVGGAMNNYAAIDAVYGSASPASDTPTGEALSVVADGLADLETDGPKIIILATDGEPDTCAEPNPQHGQALAVDAAKTGYAKGIRTFVLGVGDDVGESHLLDMANAGAGVDPATGSQAKAFRPATKQELVSDLAAIIEHQRTCVLPLDGEVDDAMAAEAEVTLDGQTLEYGSDDGWRLQGNRHIELIGAACDALSSGAHEVEGTFFCSGGAPMGQVK